MNPPCNPGVFSNASKYSPRQPLLLPIACEYSHKISGRQSRVVRAHSTISETAEYIGQTRSVP